MTKLVNSIRPSGQRDDYRFVKDNDTGRIFKALVHFEETEGYDPVVKVSIAEVDEDAHAIKRPDGTPVLVWHSHTFTPVELEDPDFDAEHRVSAMLYTAIAADEARRLARTKIGGLADKWKGRKGLDLAPPPPSVTPDADSTISVIKGE